MKNLFKKSLLVLMVAFIAVFTLSVTSKVKAADEDTATITFDDKSKRTSYSTSEQIWEENGITVTNNKASSTTNVGDYAKPARFYANSSLVISHECNINEIVFDCNSSSYATALKNSIGNNATVSSDKVTYSLDGQSNEITVVSKFTAQVRIDAITVTYEVPSDEPNVPEYIKNFQKLETVSSLNVSYTYAEVTSSSIVSWELVKDVSSLKVGDQIIIAAKDYEYALSTTQNNNNRGQSSITKNDEGDQLEIDENNVEIISLTEGNVSGSFGFETSTQNYLYAASSSSNYLKTETNLTANSSWKVTIDEDGTATILAQGTNTRNYLQYNATNKLFACYAPDKPQTPVCIYKYTESSGTEIEYSIKENGVGLRFGCLIPKDIYDDLLAEEYSFGINFVSGENDKDFIVESIASVVIDEKEYYQYSIVINKIPNSSYEQIFTATCFAKLGDTKILMQPTTYSVITILENYVKLAKDPENNSGLDKDLMQGLLEAARR
ncbi:MAG: hypothetical protein IJB21_03695 [Bacilli bacterium]|nr:hypothetical protein [Bacilli bacterium]